jgi:hypothetical protein
MSSKDTSRRTPVDEGSKPAVAAADVVEETPAATPEPTAPKSDVDVKVTAAGLEITMPLEIDEEIIVTDALKKIQGARVKVGRIGRTMGMVSRTQNLGMGSITFNPEKMTVVYRTGSGLDAGEVESLKKATEAGLNAV